MSARLAPGRRASSGIRSCRKTLSLMPEAVKFHQRRAPAGREEAVSVDSLHQPVGVYASYASELTSLFRYVLQLFEHRNFLSFFDGPWKPAP